MSIAGRIFAPFTPPDATNVYAHKGQGELGDILITHGGAAGGTINLYKTNLDVGVSWAAEDKLIGEITVASGAQATYIHLNPMYFAKGLGVKLSAADIVVTLNVHKLV
jgi:hypothetical protein